MQSLFRATAAAAVFMLAAASAQADTFYQSASFVDESNAIGSYFIDNTRYLGAVFSVNTLEAVSAIGGNFTQYGDGNNIFGAIVKLAAGNTLPGDLASNTVAEVLFTPNGGDQSVALSTVLTAGNYAVVFGSGLFGATGYSGLVDSQNAVGTPSFVQYSGDTLTASNFTDATLRLTVEAAPVPEPSTALMGLAGAMLSIGIARRRRA